MFVVWLLWLLVLELVVVAMVVSARIGCNVVAMVTLFDQAWVATTSQCMIVHDNLILSSY